mgnify:FL=1
MDCLARAFAHATHTSYDKLVRAIDHPAPYHIQEIIEVLSRTFSITEVSCNDIDPTCPYTSDRLGAWLSEYSGVVAYWTRKDFQECPTCGAVSFENAAMHAVAYNHKNKTVQESDGSYSIPRNDYTIFWIIQPRPFVT